MYFYFSVFGALFYLIFYSAIIAFMAAGSAIIYQTLNWKQYFSYIVAVSFIGGGNQRCIK
jgi:hypothetical protein